MKIKYEQIGNATAIIKIGNVKIGIDPALDPEGTVYEQKRYRTKEPIYNKTTFNNIDFWLVTHNHSDHLDKTGIKVINSKVFSSSSSFRRLIKSGIKDVKLLKEDQIAHFEKDDVFIKIKAIKALHGHNPLIRFLLGTVNGYLLEVKYNNEVKTIYITSDTIFSQEVIKSIGLDRIDFLIGTLGDVKTPYKVTSKPITMTIEELVEFKKVLTPTYTLATHINDYSHFNTDMDMTKKLFNVIENGEILKLDI